MIRDFSEKKREELENQIQKIDSETLCFLTDALGDIWNHCGKWIGLLSIGNYADNVDKYQKKVLDMNNTTVRELCAVFEKVYAKDSTFAEILAESEETLVQIENKIQVLSDLIQPGFTIASAASIQKACKEPNKKLEQSRQTMNATYDRELAYREKHAALEAVKGIPGGILSFAGDVCEFTTGVVKGVVTGDFSSAVSAGWGLVNAPFNIGQDLIALSAVGLGWGIGALSGKNKNQVREQALEMSEDYLKRDGLTSELKALSGEDGSNGWGKLAYVSESIDKTKNVYDIYDGGKNLVNDIKEVKNLKNPREFLKNPGELLEKGLGEGGFHVNVTEKGLSMAPDRLKNTKKLVTGGQLRKYNDIYQEYGYYKNIISNTQTVKGYTEAAFGQDQSVGQEVFGHTSMGGLAQDAYDFWTEDLGISISLN